MHDRKSMQATTVGFEPAQGDPIRVAGRRLNHSANVSMEACLGAANAPLHAHMYISRCQTPASHSPQQQSDAETRDRTVDFQIFSLTLSQLSYRGCEICANVVRTKLSRQLDMCTCPAHCSYNLDCTLRVRWCWLAATRRRLQQISSDSRS